MEVYDTDVRTTALGELKQIIGTHGRDTYALKVRARKRFRELGYRNYVQMAEVFVEMYVASFRTRHPEGWFFKTHKWWLEHHGPGRKTVDHARKYLRDLGIVEERHWIGNRVEYRLIPATIVEVLFPEGLNSSRPSDKDDPSHNSGTSDGDVPELPVGTDRIVPHVPSRSSHRGNLIEEKAKEVEEKRKSVSGAPAVSPPDQTPSSSDQESRDPRAASTEHSEGNDLGEQCVEVLEAALEEDGLTPMSSKERVRFRDEYASLVTQLGLGPDQLRGGPLRRQLERWGDIHLPPRVAYDDAAKRRYPEMDKTEWRMWRVFG